MAESNPDWSDQFSKINLLYSQNETHNKGHPTNASRGRRQATKGYPQISSNETSASNSHQRSPQVSNKTIPAPLMSQKHSRNSHGGGTKKQEMGMGSAGIRNSSGTKPNTSEVLSSNIKLSSNYKGGDMNSSKNYIVNGDNIKERGKKVPPTYTKFGYKRLKSMVDTSDSNDITLYICNNSDIFNNFLKEKPRPDLMNLLMQLVVKAISTEFKSSKIQIYTILCGRDFIDHLNIYIASLLTLRDSNKFMETCNFFENLNLFFEDILNLLPSKAVETLDNLLCLVVLVLDDLRKKSQMFSNPLNFAEKIKGDLDVVKERWEHCDKDTNKMKSNFMEKPPNDFRDLSLYPTPEDLETRNFLRKNIVEGRYEDVYHYLDVQFRLLREDFIDPLRVGIKQFKEESLSLEKKKNFNVRIYRNVRFLGIHFDPKKTEDLSYSVQLDEKYSSKIRWEYSKRLLFGSLLLFTKDDFVTFQLATVSDRDVNELKKGIFNIVLVGENVFKNGLMTDTFIMAESNAFFEPVFQTLSTIRDLPIDELPMQRYLLVQDISPKQPHYLSGKNTFILKHKQITINDDSSWPPCESMGFNESQYAALKSTMRNEFVVIQGPPGTGKTYLGLNLVKTLLSNFDFKSPVLMVCYTNHALDQFLEGLLGVTDKIVRIGGQSKNEALNQYNYRLVKRRHRRIHHPAIVPLKQQMSACMSEIASYNNMLDNLKKYIGILNLCEFKHFELKGFDRFDNSIDLVYWLLGDYGDSINYLINHYKIGGNTSNKNPVQRNGSNNNEEIDDKEGSDSYSEDEEEERRRNAAEAWNDVEDLDTVDKEMKVDYVFTISKLEILLSTLENQLFELNLLKLDDQDYKNGKMKLIINDVKLVQNILTHLKLRLGNENQKSSIPFAKLFNVNKWTLTEDDRWALYHYWLKGIQAFLSEKISDLQISYSETIKVWNEVKVMEDYSILKEFNPKILGLTTTGAARHHSLLSVLKPSVIIVEEAAEVLEAHILVSLTKSCQHLILIGDHKQLKPSPSTYKLAKDYHLDISLFERMLRNGVGCNMLNVQHRMKPNIASLIVPTIYSDLQNHHSVSDYPPVLGIRKNLFFISHTFLEKREEELESLSNVHEAKFVIALCRHLLLQGYDPSDITILTTYSSQQFLLRDLKKKENLLKQVRMTAVDNYQGEECKIILLSLVRSNKEGKIGFLNTENRICVALSRAKHGLFIIGNMDILKQNSEIWNKINTTLESQEAIGESLSLVCQVHKTVTEVKSAKDFDKIIEGGCHLMCLRMMPCGHFCQSLCHVLDPDHTTIKCHQPCIREVCGEPGHTCPLRCHQKCQPCKVIMKRVLPQCNHVADLECHKNPSDHKCLKIIDAIKPDCKHKVEFHCFMPLNKVKCTTPCKIRLDCGHSCTRTCHVNDDPEHLEFKCLKDCTKNNQACKRNHHCQKRCWEECGLCIVKVKQIIACGHTHDIECSMNLDEFVCQRGCSRTLPCGHKCKKRCFEKCGDCMQKVKKTIKECGHTVTVECRVDATRSLCRSACERKLACGHPCMLKCSQMCSLCQCKEYVPSPVAPSCGHPGQVLCYLSNKYTDPNSDELLRYCQHPCNKELPCKDICKGTCGSCMQGRIHQVCQEKCGNILICGHKCPVPCRDDCPPCKDKCMYRCSHSACGRKCGVPCTSCTEKCPSKCKHSKCSKLCGQLCDREPCRENCDKLLKCEHPCVGFCGEPCPPLCRICNKEKLCELFFGTEDEEDARFVFLNDCKHVLESSGLEHWMNLEPEEGKDMEIGMKTCPKCKTPIINTLRFANEVKKVFTHIQAVKKKIFGHVKEISKLQQDLVNENYPRIKALVSHSPEWVQCDQNLMVIMKFIGNVFIEIKASSKGRKSASKYGVNQLRLIQLLCIYLEDLLKTCIDFFQDDKHSNSNNSKELHKKIQSRFNLLIYHLSKRNTKISQMEMEQFGLEFERFKRIVEFYKVVIDKSASELSRTTVAQQFNTIMDELFSVKQYNYDTKIVKAIEKFAICLDSWYEPVSNDEMKMMHNAMKPSFTSASKQGHWFQCSKGHIYAITECGGAMEKAVCPECREVIGGGNHTLLSSSRLAPQMDGATHAAWSDQQNLQNYRF